jgi:hypothetical protein
MKGAHDDTRERLESAVKGLEKFGDDLDAKGARPPARTSPS